MENIDYTALIQAIIALISLIITGFIIPLLKRKLSNERLEELKKWVSVAVTAAEQIYGSKTGQQKKEFVLSFLMDKGIIFDAAEVATLLEAEVYKLTNTDFT